MPFRNELTLFLACLAAGIILHLISFDEERVGLFRLEERLRAQPELATALLDGGCATVDPLDGRTAGRFLLKRLRLPPAPNASGRCVFVVESSQTQRFYVRSYWHFAVHVLGEQGQPLFAREYPVEFPRPLAWFPVAVFLLSLVFGFRPWGLGLTLGTYTLLLGGGDLLGAMRVGWHSTLISLQGSQTSLGLVLILLWVSLHRTRRVPRPTKHVHAKALSLTNKAVSVLVGLWNPAVFTLGAKLLLPFKGSVTRLAPFLDAQFFIVCGSLYLLGADLTNPKALVTQSLLLPRYFTFAAVLFLSLSQWSQRAKPVIPWHQTRLWRGLGLVAVVELAALQLEPLRALSTITRVGLALVTSELIQPQGLAWKPALKGFGIWSLTLFTANFVTLLSVESGVSDLLLVLSEPTAHPTAVALFTFLSGVLLGFLTGNFAITFFTLYGVLIQTFDVPLVRAALTDGILAGSLLSPFSLFNLFPAAQFGLNLQELITFRFKQLGIPLTIAVLIYAVCALNSVAILQPVTFVFLCLVGLALRLKRNAWSWKGLTAKPTV